jgi:hypothetical protein
MKSKNYYLLIILLVSIGFSAKAQTVYVLKSSNIYFFAGTPIEDIEADNIKSVSFFDSKTGDIRWSIPINSFKFKNALMEEHFNENYLESEKYPKAEYVGKIMNPETYDFSKPNTFVVKVQGELTMHGIKKSKTIEVTIKNESRAFTANTKFDILLADYNIQRPQILWEKLSETVSVTSTLNYSIYKQ